MKGAAAEAYVLVENMAETIEHQLYPPPLSPSCNTNNYDGPTEDFNFDDSNWVGNELDDEGNWMDEGEAQENEVERAAWKMKVAIAISG